MSGPLPRVTEVVKNAVEGSWDLPEIQRKFVWSPDKVRDLLDSLLKDYNIGVLLLWNPSKYLEGYGKNAHWIIDGQQRVTSLCVLFDKKPYWLDNKKWEKIREKYDIMINVLSPISDIEVAVANPARKKDPKWVSVRDILPIRKDDELKEYIMLVVKKVAKKLGKSPDYELYTHIDSCIKKVWNIRDKPVLIDRISPEKDLEDVVEIFTRINMKGTKLREADIYVAIAASKMKGWVRKEFYPFIEYLKTRYGFDLFPGIILRTLTGIGVGKTRFRDVNKEFWSNEAKFKHAWENAKATIIGILEKMHQRGILSSRIVPSLNSLIPVFLLYNKFKDKEFSFCKVFYWFILANRSGRYSGSAISVLANDVRIIDESNSFKEAINKLVEGLDIAGKFVADDFRTNYKRDRFGRFILYLILYDKGATDWTTRERIGFESDHPVVGFRPEYHHFIPRSILRSHGISEDLMDDISNIVVVSKETNKRIKSKMPTVYVDELGLSDKDLEKFIIPLDRSLWDISRYEEFLKKRASMLAEEANSYLGKLLSES